MTSFRVEGLAPDFKLLDRWRFPISADPAKGEDFAAFYRLFTENGIRTDSRFADALFRIRFFAGRIFKWDQWEAIPGTSEATIAGRLDEGDRRRNRASEVSTREKKADFQPVYLFENEALIEISNRTIHALLHLAWVDADKGHHAPELSIFIKSRGRFSDFYLAAIKPFRYFFVYPPWIGRICRLWRERHQ
jgi:hypothetical protein